MTDTATQGAPLPTINPVESGIDSALTNGETLAETAIDSAIIAAVPEMATPVWKQIWEGIVAWVVSTVDKTGQLLLTFGINKVQGAIQDVSLQQAENTLQAAIASGDANAIQAATLAFQKAQSAAVNSGGSATPQ